MLSSPRRPSSTMRIFSSAEWCRRVARRISRTVFSALSGTRLLACLIVAPQQGYDEPGILSYAIRPFCPTSADGLQNPRNHILVTRTVRFVAANVRPSSCVCEKVSEYAQVILIDRLEGLRPLLHRGHAAPLFCSLALS